MWRLRVVMAVFGNEAFFCSASGRSLFLNSMLDLNVRCRPSTPPPLLPAGSGLLYL